MDSEHEVDCVTGNDAYNKYWLSDRRERWEIVAFNLCSSKGPLAASFHPGTRVARRVINALRYLRGLRALPILQSARHASYPFDS